MLSVSLCRERMERRHCCQLCCALYLQHYIHIHASKELILLGGWVKTEMEIFHVFKASPTLSICRDLS